MRRLGLLVVFGSVTAGLLAAVPRAGFGAATQRQGPPPAAQGREDLRQLDSLLGVTLESLRGQDAALLEDYLRRLLLVADRLHRPGTLDPTLREALDQRVLGRAAHVTGILRQQRLAREAGGPGAVGPERDALGVLVEFAVGVARQPLLLGGVLAGVVLLFLGGIGLGQRRAWGRPVAPPAFPVRTAPAPRAPLPAPALDARRARLAVAGGRPLLLSLSYEIKPERRRDYLAYMERLRDHLVREMGYAYAVWEQDGRPHWFTEMLLCTTAQEFDRLCGPDDSVTRRLVMELDQYVQNPGRIQRSALMGMSPAVGAARAASEHLVRTPDAVLQPDSRSVPIPRAAREVPPDALPAEAA